MDAKWRMTWRAGLMLIIVCRVPLAWGDTSGSVSEHYQKSYLAEARGDYSSALSSMAEIRALGHVDYVTHLRTGWLQYLSEKYDEAIKSYRAALSLESDAIEPRLGLMLSLMAARQWGEALTLGEQVLKKAPGDFTAQSRIAFIHYQQGQYEEAESWYRRALAGYPSNVEMRAGLGWSLLRQEKQEDARKEFERVLQVAPNHASAREGLGKRP